MRTLLAAALLAFSASQSFAAEDWPQWRGPNRDGSAVDSPALIAALPPAGLQPAWVSEKVPGGFNGGWSCPIVADGKVYLFVHHKSQKTPGPLPKKKFPYLREDARGGMSPAEYEEYEKNRRLEDLEFGKLFSFTETLLCLDVDTGKTVWRKDRPSIYTRFLHSGTLSFADGNLYVLGAGRKARCIDAATGDDVWEKVLPGEVGDEFFMSSFLVLDRTAIVFAGSLFGLDAQSGELLWEGDKDKTKGTHSSAVAYGAGEGALAIANLAGGFTSCFEARTGKERWRVKAEANQSTPVIIGNRMLTYGSSRRSGLRCYEISPSEAKEAWTYQRVADKGSSPVVVGDYVYVQGEKRLACVDLKSGDEQWNETLDLATPQYTSLVAVDGKILYAFDGLLCVAADPGECKTLIAAKFNKAGLMATEEAHRKLLKLDEVEKKENGLEESTKIFKREVGDQGPLPCTSPAVVGGRLILRLRDVVACYDLRATAE